MKRTWEASCYLSESQFLLLQNGNARPCPAYWSGSESGSRVGGMEVECLGVCLGLGWTVFIWVLLLPALPRPSLPDIQPQALPPPSGSEAAAAGLCAGQCILKVSGNNVMNDSAPEVLEHFQAFRNRREEALVCFSGKPCSVGGGLRATSLPWNKSLKAVTAFWVRWAAYLEGLSWAWTLCPSASLNWRSWAVVPMTLVFMAVEWVC